MTRTPATIFDRSVALERLAGEEYDILVVGGGITGAGVALEAAAGGLRTALVERSDFASGTSSKSSKLVHGGLRYLHQRELGLVHESLLERQRLLTNAPHLVQPLTFLIPLFGKGGVVDGTVVRAFSLALWGYDAAGGWRIGKRHRKITAAEIKAHLPTLRSEQVVAGFLYYDASTDDARLTLSVLRTAVLEHGAVAANYAAVTGFVRGARGRITGASLADGTEIRARAVVNATGVWADELCSLDPSDGAPSLRPAKGTHLVVSRSKLPWDTAAVIPVPGDRRSIFVVPWGDHTYLGTTDTDYDGPLDDPQVTGADVDYILGAINSWVTVPLRPSDVTATWAGLRPLLASAPGRPNRLSERTADLSRRHRVVVSPEGLVTITGGKLTTYRKMAEDTLAVVRPALGERRRPSRTRRLPLRGAAGAASLTGRRAAAELGVQPAALDHLRRRYGGEATAVIGLAANDPGLMAHLVPGLPYLRAEAVYAVRYEMARTLEDVLARRTRALLLEAEATAAAAPDVAALVGTQLGWDAERASDEVARVERLAHASLAAARAPGRPAVGEETAGEVRP
jgi:glycerol-3-phosphate dehydrogenase